MFILTSLRLKLAFIAMVLAFGVHAQMQALFIPTENDNIECCSYEEQDIDALDIVQFVEYISLDIENAKTLFNQIDGPKIIQLNKELSYVPLSEEECISLKQQLKHACLAVGTDDFYSQAESVLDHAEDAITHRLELTPHVAFILEPVLKWIDSFKADMHTAQALIAEQIKK